MTACIWITALFLNMACTRHIVSTPETVFKKITLPGVPDTLTFKSGIRSILQDSKGNYWFGSDQEGVCRYDGTTYTYFSPENGFCGKQVIDIREDETGVIWFGTSSGICKYDGNTFTTLVERVHNPNNVLEKKEYDAWAAEPTDIWFAGTTIHELIRIDAGEMYTVHYPLEIPLHANPGDYGITGFSASKIGGLWIAHYAGVAYFDGTNFRLINDSTMHYDGTSKYLHVRSLLEDSKGRLWIGNNGIGVQVIEQGFISHFSAQHHLFSGEPFRMPARAGTLMHVFAIHEDAHGNIWFGDRDTGAWRFDGNEIKNFPLDPALNSQHIWDIYEDRSGNLLFASAASGIYRFNGNGFDRVF